MAHSERLKEWLKLYKEHRYLSVSDEEHTDQSTDKQGFNNFVKDAEREEHEVFIGFSKRFYAFVIDVLVLSIFLMELNSPVLFLLIASIYYSVLTCSPLKGTIGKAAVGAVVVDSNGNRISFIRALLRFYAYGLSMAILFVGYLMILLNYESRSLHDFVCNTYVVNKEILIQSM